MSENRKQAKKLVKELRGMGYKLATTGSRNTHVAVFDRTGKKQLARFSTSMNGSPAYKKARAELRRRGIPLPPP
jgi:hypothetical protein